MTRFRLTEVTIRNLPLPEKGAAKLSRRFAQWIWRTRLTRRYKNLHADVWKESAAENDRTIRRHLARPSPPTRQGDTGGTNARHCAGGAGDL